ncbi:MULTISPECIES: hypothetical protein [unclassified Streptomyces]|uniref:hypothetical protein n=1 Tax=unclassified Streptomyces TaxID=2593676 RepID=UPI003250A4A6
MRNRIWIAAAGATAAVAVAAGLWIDALGTGHTDGGLKADPAGIKAATGDGKCVGTRPVDSLPDADDGTPLMRVVVHIDKLSAHKRYASVFTGLSVDDDDQAADVWRIPSAAFDDEVCGSAVKGVTVRLHDTDIDRKTLDRLSDRIGDDMKRWDGTFQMREVAVDEHGFVLIGVDDPDKAEPIIKKAYGESNRRYIRVEYVDQAELLDAD